MGVGRGYSHRYNEVSAGGSFYPQHQFFYKNFIFFNDMVGGKIYNNCLGVDLPDIGGSNRHSDSGIFSLRFGYNIP